MSAWPSFTLTVDMNKLLPQLTGGELTELAWQGILFEFTSNIDEGALLTWEGRVIPTPDPVRATIESDGTFQGTGDPLKLLANDPGLNTTTPIRHEVQVTIPGRRTRPWSFIAPNDGATLDLSAVVPPAPAVGGGIDGGSSSGGGSDVIDGGSA